MACTCKSTHTLHFQTKLTSLETFHVTSYTICSVITILYAQSIQIFTHYTTEINAKCLPIMLALCSMLCHSIMLQGMLA